MRTWILLPCLVLLSMMSLAQQSSPNQGNPNSAPAGAATAVTIVGCVGSVNGYFTLGTSRGDRYRLKGDHDTLLGYNGKQVAITGTAVTSPEKVRTLQISKIKKISDTCQF